ncbi:MAG: MucB/RseB C-terminal domain-containing protein [Nitrosomonadaceae bacterium]
MIKSFAIVVLILPLSGFALPSFAEDALGVSTEAQSGLQSVADASASIEAQVWLQSIVDAPRKHNYTGIFVYSSGGHMETSRVVHMVNSEGEFERIEVLDGSPREVIRNNDEVRCYFPDRKTVVTGKRGLQKFFPALLPEPLSNLNNNYIVKKGGKERISDYECQVIVLKSKDNMRYSQKLWVEVATGLLLKAAVMDQDQVVEQFVFTQLEIDGEIDEEFLKPRYVTEITEIHVTNPVSSGMVEGKLGWQVENLPPGFSKINEVKRNFSGKSTPVGHITLSDGLAAVSVFIKPVTKNEPLDARESYPRQGAINIYTRTVGDNVVTTIGEVPPATVMQIGNSVKNYKVKWTE